VTWREVAGAFDLQLYASPPSSTSRNQGVWARIGARTRLPLAKGLAAWATQDFVVVAMVQDHHDPFVPLPRDPGRTAGTCLERARGITSNLASSKPRVTRIRP
jgi:hypothetical protein